MSLLKNSRSEDEFEAWLQTLPAPMRRNIREEMVAGRSITDLCWKASWQAARHTAAALEVRVAELEALDQALCVDQAFTVARMAELESALLDTARRVEALKQPCGTDPQSAQALRNGRYMSIALIARAALKGSP